MPRASLQVAGDPGFAKRAKWDDGVSLRGIEDVDDEGNDMSDRLRVHTGSVLFPVVTLVIRPFDSALDLCWSFTHNLPQIQPHVVQLSIAIMERKLEWSSHRALHVLRTIELPTDTNQRALMSISISLRSHATRQSDSNSLQLNRNRECPFDTTPPSLPRNVDGSLRNNGTHLKMATHHCSKKE